MERCESSDLDHAGNGVNTAKLLGAAYFDDPFDPPSSFESVLLWDASDYSIFVQEQALNDDIVGDESAAQSRLKRSEDVQKHIARVNGCKPLINAKRYKFDINSPSDLLWAGKKYRRRRRMYYLLHIEPTKHVGRYKRVGIGIGYWLPNLEPFGGVQFPKVSKRKTLIPV